MVVLAVLVIVGRFGLCGRPVPHRLEGSSVAESSDPVEGAELHLHNPIGQLKNKEREA